MNLVKFINRESDVPKSPIIIMAIISGIANSLVLAFINQAAEMVSSSVEIEIYFFILYVFAVSLFIYTRKYSLSQATMTIEETIAKVRIRIVNKIRGSELIFIENKGKVEIYTDLTQDANFISQAANVLINAAQSSIVLFFCLFYVAWLSPVGFILIALSVLLGLFTYASYAKHLSETLHQAKTKETEFFETLNHVLDGFKEIKINQQKNSDLFAHVKTISDETERLKISAGIQFITNLIFSNIVTILILGIIVFLLPIFSPTHVEVVVKMTATMLFILGPIETILSAIPTFAQANLAVETIQQLESELDANNKQTVTLDKISEKKFFGFRNIQLENIIFQYLDKEGNSLFNAGPLNLTIQRGEILFIVGGNGSGKSTLLKLLTGLYYPYTGVIVAEDEIIDKYNYSAYRELFSIVFTDFHLFDRVYGLPAVDEQQLKKLLHLMALERKTKYIDGRFTHTNLSTGQKKRLAFITAVLEDKPIYIFDELAADQDPQFRKYFYEEVLPDLRNQGKTIIAVTHDDMYFDRADRVLKMDYGKIIS